MLRLKSLGQIPPANIVEIKLVIRNQGTRCIHPLLRTSKPNGFPSFVKSKCNATDNLCQLQHIFSFIKLPRIHEKNRKFKLILFIFRRFGNSLTQSLFLYQVTFLFWLKNPQHLSQVFIFWVS